MVSNGRETGNGRSGDGVQYEIRKCQDMFGSEFIALFTTNSSIGLTMEILPVALEEDNGFKYQKNRLTVQFLDLQGGLLYAEDDYINGSDIPDLNMEDKDIFEELLSKYARTFSKVKKYEDYKDLIYQIFLDIEEARIARESVER